MASAPRVGIVLGSASDLTVMGRAAETLHQFGVPFEMTVASVHRAPERAAEYARTAADRGLALIIAAAGKAAALPGVVAALTPLPVIGVPLRVGTGWMDELAAISSMLQLPTGNPVAVVGVGDAHGAALLAIRVLALHDSGLRERLEAHQQERRAQAQDAARKAEEMAETVRQGGPAEGGAEDE